MNNTKFSVSLRRLAVATTLGGLSLVPLAAHACAAEPLIGSVCTVAYATRGCPSGYVRAGGQLLQINQYQALYSLIGTVFGGDARTTFAVPNLNGKSPVGVGPASVTSNGVANSTVGFGDYRGAETVTLTQAQMPAHTHVATFVPTTAAQAVTIPAQAGSGSITATASTAVVPGSGGVDPSPNVANYYLTGVTSNASGPVTTTAPGTDKSTLIGTTVTVDSSNYKPPIPQASVQVNTVTGGAVTNQVAGSSQPALNLPPQVGLYYCIATMGIYPSFD